jgi:succinate dehydrogenase / fumarate reductase membrane anchor subunit
MAYLTDRKRAIGWGAAKTGTDHAWAMKKSSVALLILIPLFVFTFGAALGGTHAEVLDYYSRPFPAIVAALTFVVGLKHFNDGVQVLIEDYVHGLPGKIALMVMMCLSYGTMAVGLFAIARLAL